MNAPAPVRTKIPGDFPVGPNQFAILDRSGYVRIDECVQMKDHTAEHDGIEYAYDHDRRILRVRALDKYSKIPSADFCYEEGAWWCGAPSDKRGEGKLLWPTYWVTDLADQFGLDFTYEGFFHAKDGVLKVGPITFSTSDAILIGGQSRPSTAPFPVTHCDNVICRATGRSDLRSDGGVPMIEILDKNSGDIFYYRHDLVHYWFQYTITRFEWPAEPTQLGLILDSVFGAVVSFVVKLSILFFVLAAVGLLLMFL